MYGGTVERAGSHVALFVHSARATFTGGHLIDLTTVDQSYPRTWAEFHGADIADGRITVFKAVRDDLKSQHGALYEIGAEVTCDDWQDTDACGNGLHFSPSPAQASAYDHHATRWLECTVLLSELRPITDSNTPKAKAPRATVVREVDIAGRPIKAKAAAK
jgi:hypothetical protein